MPHPIVTILFLLVVLTSCSSEAAEPAMETITLKPVANALADSTLFNLVVGADSTLSNSEFDHFVDSVLMSYSSTEPGLAYAIYRRGANAYSTDKYEQATADYREALTRYLAADELELPRILRLQVNLANLMELRGINDSIFFFVEQGLQLVDDYPNYDHNKDDLIDFYLLGGLAYRNQGDLKLALDYFQSGGELCEANVGEYYTMGRFETQYGRTLAMTGELERAEDRIIRSLNHLNPKIKGFDNTDRSYRADAFRAYCEVLSKKKDYQGMEGKARAAHAITGHLQAGTKLEADDLNNIGYALVYQNKLTEGRSFLQRALALYQKINEETSQGHSYENLAEAARQEGNYATGIEYLRKAEQCYHGIPDQPGLEQALNPEKMIEATMEVAHYGMLLHQQDSAAFALPQVVTAAARVDSLLGLLRYSVRSEESKRLLVGKLRPLHERILDFSVKGYSETSDPRYLNLGLHYLARSKAQVLNERRTANQLLSLDEGREELYADQQAIRTLKDRYRREKNPSTRTELLEELQRNEFNYRRKTAALFGQAQLDYVGLPDEPDARAIQAVLPENQAVLDYFIGDSLVFAGVYTASDLSLVKLDITANELREHVVKINEFLRSPSKNRYQNDREYRDSIEANYVNSSNVLHDALLPETITSGGYDHLTILLDGPLHRLPFAALTTSIVPRSDWGDYPAYPFLLKGCTINYEFSLQAWLERLQSPPSFPSDRLVVAPTQPQAVTIRPAGMTDAMTLAALNTSESENESVSELIDARTLRKTGANRAKFMRVASNYGLIHFAGHGVANTADPYQSFLVFSESDKETTDNDLLYLRDLERLQLQADLLVLSACQTAEGELSQGEGVISLGRAGALAGAGSVIASNWAVNQAAKAVFFPLFYEQLLVGQRRDVALQQAKLKLIKSDERFGHPYFWAGFGNYGNGGVVGRLTE